MNGQRTSGPHRHILGLMVADAWVVNVTARENAKENTEKGLRHVLSPENTDIEQPIIQAGAGSHLYDTA